MGEAEKLMSIRKRVKMVFAACLLSFSCTFAQGPTTGRIEGTVKDQNGAVVQGAAIIVKNTETALERTVTTNSNGGFTVSVLPVGTYKITARQTGFAEMPARWNSRKLIPLSQRLDRERQERGRGRWKYALVVGWPPR